MFSYTGQNVFTYWNKNNFITSQMFCNDLSKKTPVPRRWLTQIVGDKWGKPVMLSQHLFTGVKTQSLWDMHTVPHSSIPRFCPQYLLKKYKMNDVESIIN
jgi:hypothetical protein